MLYVLAAWTHHAAGAALIALASAALAFVFQGGCATPPPPLSLSDTERASQPTLLIGDPAPPLEVSEWVRGEPVVFAPGHVYVVDFWAVWCGPCIAVMPRLSAHQDAWRGRATVIAFTSVDEANTPGRIRAHVRQHESEMRMHVAIDQGMSTAERYRRGALDNALPRSFVIDQQGRLAWIGHPAEVGPVVESVLAGSWDVGRARSERAHLLALEQERARLERELSAARSGGNRDTQLRVLDTLCDPRFVPVGGSPVHWMHPRRIRLLREAGRIDDARRAADESLAIPAFQDDGWALADLALELHPLDPARAGALGDRAEALLADAHSRTPRDPWEAYLHEATVPHRGLAYTSLAALRFAQGRARDAVALQRIAVESFNPIFAEADAAREALARYEAAAGETAAGAAAPR